MRDDKTMMDGCLAAVMEFHEACDAPIETKPTDLSDERRALRRKLIDEEVNKELLPMLVPRHGTHGYTDGDLAEIADAIGDSIYVLLGTAVEMGLPMGRVWAAIQQANMAKINPATGKADKRPDGKVLKPLGWQEPDILSIIQEAK